MGVLYIPDLPDGLPEDADREAQTHRWIVGGIAFLLVAFFLFIGLVPWSPMNSNEKYMQESPPGVPEANPPTSEIEFYQRTQSGFYPHGPRPTDGYPGMESLKGSSRR